MDNVYELLEENYSNTVKIMIKAGYDFYLQKKWANISHEELDGIFGMTFNQSKDMKLMQSAMYKASGEDCTGGQMHTATNKVLELIQQDIQISKN